MTVFALWSTIVLSTGSLAFKYDTYDHYDLYARDADLDDLAPRSLYTRGVLDARAEIFEALKLEARSTCRAHSDGKHKYQKVAGSGCACKCGHIKTFNIC